MAGPLAGLRVLVAEDDFHIAMLLEEQLSAAGSAVAGPSPRISEALAAAEGEAYDAAVLDINVGWGAGLPGGWRARPAPSRSCS